KGQPMFRIKEQADAIENYSESQKKLRNKLLAKAHILAKKLGYDSQKNREAYEKFINEKFGIESLKNIRIGDLQKITSTLNKLNENRKEKKLLIAKEDLSKIPDSKKIYDPYNKTIIFNQKKLPKDTKYLKRLRERSKRLTKDTKINTFKMLEEALNKAGADTKIAFWDLQEAQRRIQIKNNERMIEFHKEAQEIYQEEKNTFEKVTATRADYENNKFTTKLINYLETGEAEDRAVRRIGELYKEYNEGFKSYVRATRLYEYILTGNEQFIDFVDEENIEQVTEAINKIVDILENIGDERYALDRAIEKIIEEMDKYEFGVRETYYPTEHEPTAEEFAAKKLSMPGKTKGKTGRLKTGKGVPDVKSFWYEFNNKIYNTEGLMKFMPRIEALRNTLSKEQNKVMDSMYNTILHIDAGLNEAAKAFKIWFSLGFQAYLLSPKGLGADIRNLTQNIAMMFNFPVRTMLKENGKNYSKKLLNLLKTKKQLGEKELENKFLDHKEKEFLRHLSAKGVFSHAMFISGVWTKEVPILRKVEFLANTLSKHYTGTDVLNRKIAVTLLKPLANLAEKTELKDYEKLSKKLAINQFHPSTQMALADIFKYDKAEFFTEYIRQKVLKIHHQYERSGRSIFMQARQTRVLSPLLVFPVSTISKYMESLGNMFGKNRTATDRIQSAEVVFFKSIHDVTKMAMKVALWAGTTLGLYSLIFGTGDDEEKEFGSKKYAKMKKTLQMKRNAEKLVKFSSYICPPMWANYIISQVKGYDYDRYGLKEMQFGTLPLSRFLTGLEDFMWDLTSGRLSVDQVLQKHGTATVANLPFLKLALDHLSTYYDMTSYKGAPILIDTLIKKGKLPSRERFTEIRELINKEMKRQGYQAFYSKKFEELNGVQKAQAILFGRESSVYRSRNKAIAIQFQRRVLADLMAWSKPGSKEYKKLEKEYNNLGKKLDKASQKVPVTAKVINDNEQYRINMKSETIDKKLKKLLGVK
ncbi:MAG: hypothetical protein KGY74_10560, partial [Candidatus Cloacimonetes bacterium]|nr:hypothetical protein [Candidatus Cloacimonadota bacterium]